MCLLNKQMRNREGGRGETNPRPAPVLASALRAHTENPIVALLTWASAKRKITVGKTPEHFPGFSHLGSSFKVSATLAHHLPVPSVVFLNSPPLFPLHKTYFKRKPPITGTRENHYRLPHTEGNQRREHAVNKFPLGAAHAWGIVKTGPGRR